MTLATRARSAGLVWLAVIGWSTLRSAPAQAPIVAALPWYCLACGQSGIADVLLNLLLFLPLGLVARALGWPGRRTLLLLFVLTVGIEATQGLLLVGRDASLGDVLSNTTGGMIGWLAYPGLCRLGCPSAQVARRCAAIVLLVAVAVWLATAAALRPLLIEDAPWVGQHAHQTRYQDPFPGTLLRAALNGVEIPDGEMVPVRNRTESLDLAVDINRLATASPLLPASLLRVIDPNQRIEVDVTQRGDDAIVELASRGAAWRLHQPEWRFSGALRMPADQPWRLHWRWRRDGIELTRGPIGGKATVAMIPISVALGWVFIHPYTATISQSESIWTALWLAWWFGLLGWLAGWCGVLPRWVFGGSAIVALAAIGVATGMPVSPLQLATALVSYLLLLGAAARKRGSSR